MKPYEFRGEIIDAGTCQEFGEKKFKKRVILVSDGNDKYPRTVPFELTKDAADATPQLGMATVKFYLDSREWNGRHFVSLKVAEIIMDDAAPMPEAKPEPPPQKTGDMQGEASDDNLPF